MNKHLVDFENMQWINAGKGIRYKVYNNGSQQVRLVEFLEGFIEEDWCTQGHIGYVLEGSFSADFSGVVEKYKAGDIIFIPRGGEDRHKAILGKNERVLLLLCEII
ncbi:MAG: hypothetical protein PHC69_12235 [Ruminiclostridium sp.]|nr:hypothetical protein [Ruminiclostridium sp.]